MKFIFFATLVVVSCISCVQPKKTDATAYYKNPVITGDFPDPSVIRVGNTYYAAGTTSDFGPNYALYESTDLVNWKQIGFIFKECPEWAGGSFWAPELYYNKGTFFVYYTAKRKSDSVSCIGVATTTDIHNGFQDQGILIEWGNEAIDAFVFKDDDGKFYMSWKAYGLTEGRPIEILCSELSADGLHLVGEHFTLTDFSKGWNGAGDEGQCLVKRGDYYYLLYSVGGCCDNQCTYQVMVSRSKNLQTGWEQKSEPILKGGEQWLCTGHGTLVSTPDGRDFYMYHSYNATDFEYIGRQGMLDEIVWDEQTNWPRLKSGNTPSEKAPVPFENTIQKRDTMLVDDFTGDESVFFWQWDLKVSKPLVTRNDGELLMEPTANGISFWGISPKVGNYSLKAEITNESAVEQGICIYGNQQNLLAFGKNAEGLVLFQIENGMRTNLATIPNTPTASVNLKFDVVHGRFFQFFWADDDENWRPVKVADEYTVDGQFLPQWGVAMRSGLYVDGGKLEVAKFSNLNVRFKF